MKGKGGLRESIMELMDKKNMYREWAHLARGSIDCSILSETAGRLRMDYENPEFLTQEGPGKSFLQDMMDDFDLNGARFLILGPAGGGARFHKDMFHSSFWNANIYPRSKALGCSAPRD